MGDDYEHTGSILGYRQHAPPRETDVDRSMEAAFVERVRQAEARIEMLTRERDLAEANGRETHAELRAWEERAHTFEAKLAEAEDREAALRVALRDERTSKRRILRRALDYKRKLAEAEATLERAQAIQPKRVEWFREQRIVFDKAPADNSDFWQSIAFAIYSDLCEVESITRAALRSLRGET